MGVFVKAKKALIGVLALGIAFSGGITSAQAQDPSAPPTSTIGAARGAGDTLSDARFVFEGTSLVGLTDQGKSELAASKVLKNLPAGVSAIGPEVFSGLELKEVELPDSVVEVGDRAFYNNQITTLKAPGLVKVGQGAFQANKLTGLPSEKIEQLGDGAFADNQLSELKLTSDKLNTIPADAFRDNRLTKVELPASATEVGAGAFANNQLESFNFHDGLVKIGDKAFAGNRFTKVDFPNSLAEFGAEVFADNGRWIEVGAHPDCVTNQAYEGGFGHVVDAVTIRVNFVDQNGKQIQSPQILSSEFTEPHGVYLKGVENTFDAPDLEGFEATNSPLKFTPDADGFEVTATYKQVDYSPRITGNLNKSIAFNGDGSSSALLDGVTATDYKGNPLTVTVSPTSVDTSVQEQLTEVFYTATDSEGRSKTVKGRVLVGIDWPEMTICPGWQVKDFVYEGSKIIRFSEIGHKKAYVNGDKLGCWPHMNDKGEPVNEIGTGSGFRDLNAIPDSWGSIEIIGDGAFNSSRFKSVPKSWGKVKKIGSYVFANTAIESIPDDWGEVTEIGYGSFSGTRLKDIPNSFGKVTRIGGFAFGGIWGGGKLTLKDWGEVTEISDSAFYNAEFDEFPDNWGKVKTIGTQAFMSIKIPCQLPRSFGEVTHISDYAFTAIQGPGYTAPVASVIDDWGKVVEVGQNAFQGANIRKLPDSWGGVTTLGEGAFGGNKIPGLPDNWGNLTSIGGGAFANNEITSIPNSWGELTSIGGYTFANNALTRIPDSWGNLTEIEGNAFLDNKLTALPDNWGNIASIGDGAFSGNSLSALPGNWGNVASLGNDAFANNRLTSLPDSWGKITSIGGGAFTNNRLTSLPDSWGEVTELGSGYSAGAFSSNLLTSLPLSWGKITKIGDYAFQSNKLSTLPDSWGQVTEIGKSAFHSNNLAKLPDSLSDLSKIGDYAFESNNLPNELIFTVPQARLAEAVKALSDGKKDAFGGSKVFVKPDSGKNPDGVKSTAKATILVDTSISVKYVTTSGGNLKPEEILKKDTREGDTYTLVAPVFTGYRTPADQTVNLDGANRNVVFTYQPLSKAEIDGFGKIKLTGVHTHDKIGSKLRTDLGFDSAKQLSSGSVVLTYDPEHVEFVEAATVNGVKSVKQTSPGVVTVEFGKTVPTGTSFTIPIHWKLKPRVTASDTKFPVSATLMAGRDAGMGVSPVDLSGFYSTPTLEKDVRGLYDRQYTADFDSENGAASISGKNYVTYDFQIRYLDRDVSGFKLTDTLPSYLLGDGSNAKAVFVASENPGWSLDGDKLTYSSDASISRDSAGLASLKLHYPGAVENVQITNSASVELTPNNRGTNEPLIVASDDASFAFRNFVPKGSIFAKTANGPHYSIENRTHIFDTTNDRAQSVPWSINLNAADSDLPALMVEDHGLDARLQYVSIIPDEWFVGGHFEIVNAKGKVDYSAGITSTEEIAFPSDVVSARGAKLRMYTSSSIPKGRSSHTTVITKLRDPEASIFSNDDASKNVMLNKATLHMAGSSGEYEAAVKIMPAGKTFTATKSSDFAGRTLTGKSGTYQVGSRIETDYGTPATNFELVDVLPKGLDIEQVQLSGAFASLPGARYEVISNFNGTGQVAIKFHADQVNDESEVRQVGNIRVFISGATPEGTMTNEVFVRANGENIKFGNPVNNPVAGAGVWSRAENSTQVSAATEMYVRKQIRVEGGFWTSHISTIPGAKFDYRLQAVNSTDQTRTNPVIYDLLPTPGDATLYNGDRGSQFVNQVAGNPSLPAGWSVSYTCDTGLAQESMPSASWSASNCGAVTGLRFSGPNLQPRSSAEIAVPMLAGPAGSSRLSTDHLGQQAVNHVTYGDGQTIGLIESNSVINVLEAPRVNVEFKKLGVTLIPLVGAKTAPLPGATFGLFDENGQQQASAISGNDGMVRFNAPVRVGWTIREIKAPEGFNISESAYTVSEDDVRSGVVKAPDVKNMSSWVPVKPITGSVEFTKVDKNGGPIDGVEFKLTPKPDSSGKTVNIDPLVVRSNSDGLVKFYGVPAGVYELSETPGVTNLQPIAPQRVVIGRMGQVVKIDGGKVVNDKGRIELTKLGLRGIDRKGFGEWSKSDGIAKQGAKFELYQGNTLVNSYTADSDGRAVLENLAVDTVYTLREVSAPDGYDLNPNSYQFQVNAKGILTDANGKMFSIQEGIFFPNEQTKQTSSVAITKTDPNNPETGVGGAVFELAKKVDGDWVVQSSATSNSSGQAEFAGLSGGEYRVRETAAPMGYAPTSKTFEFMVDDYNSRQFTWTAVNYSTSLQVSKSEPIASGISSDAADKLVSENAGAVKTTSGGGLFDVSKPLAGAVFDVFDDNDQLVAQIQTDASGLARVPNKLDATRTYKLVETSSPKGYIKKSNPLFVRIGDHSLRSGFNGTVRIDVPNTPRKGKVTISKMAAGDGKPLAGAKFELSGPEGFKKSATTDKAGLASFDGLDFDTDYQLKEVSAPKGFKTDDSVRTIRVGEDNPISTQVIYNKADSQELVIHKVTDASKPLAGVEFTLEDEAGKQVRLPASDSKGVVRATLETGQVYRIKEVATVDGFALLPQDISVKFTESGTLQLVDGGVATAKVAGADGLVIVNYPQGKVPLSGRGGVLPLLILGALAAVASVPFIVGKRKKKGCLNNEQVN
ncbi:hypothetical protein HMPREF9306_01245 [Propionimicrobium lymphophilum ACS-093-V-SCH5]|uniref:Uncharacterized protein n=1 Tax=Propionimicrobium lymphophilum ACS-093-V-SCH5 TaxID=883161 RepID=S2WJU5_9ACTN|nr:SpaA isopeptide-forming pilin-related protein [Propionimicrobium lymphophilum]EPD32937.1 hypothetical protein HMPREF9306_01245 [Propionimicrobium lymphophilum ACS-093-V-SCH5]